MPVLKQNIIIIIFKPHTKKTTKKTKTWQILCHNIDLDYTAYAIHIKKQNDIKPSVNKSINLISLGNTETIVHEVSY